MKRDAPAVGGRSRQSSGPPGQGPRAQQLRSIAGEAAPRAKAPLLGGSAFRDLLLEAVAVSCSPPVRLNLPTPMGSGAQTSAACRTDWNRGFTAPERTGSRVSWRSRWPGDTAGMYHLSRQSAGSAAAPPADPGGTSAEKLRHTSRNQWRNIGQLTDVSDMQVAEIFLVQQASGGIAPGALPGEQHVQVTGAAPESAHSG
jgi:hypothetical protein